MSAEQSEKPGILVLNGCLPPPYGGIAKYMSYLLPELVARGYPLWTVMRREYSPESYAEFAARGVQVCIPRKHTKLTLPIAWRLASRYPKALWQRCGKHRLPIKEAFGILNQWLPEADRLLAANCDKIDIIHAYDAPWAQGWIGALLAQKYRKAFVMTTYGEVVPHRDEIELLDDLSYQYQGFCAEVVRHADILGSMTSYCASKLAFIGVAPDQVWPTNHIVGMEEFLTPPQATQPLVDRYPMLKEKRLILFVGQLQRRKGPDLLMQAAPTILAKHPDCVFAFIGPDYGLASELHRLAEAQGIADRCLITGAIPAEELQQFYHQAALFTFTTISKIECLGLTFVQAMHAHCPVVAANISGVPEVLRHAENGLLFEPGNAIALGDAILQILALPDGGKALAEQAFHDITTNFSAEVAIQHVEAIYRAALHHVAKR